MALKLKNFGNAALADADLIGFDVDGTLVEAWTPEILIGVPELIAELKDSGKRLFVATNQGGLFWRALTGQRKFPSPRRLGEAIPLIAERAGLLDVPWLIAVHPGSEHDSEKKNAITARAAAELEQQLKESGVFTIAPEISAGLHWRKPDIGMLERAQELLGKGRLTYVGDLDTDRELAENAGAIYLDALDWRR